MFFVDAAHPPGGWDHHIPQVVLEVPGEKELRAVTEKLTEAGVQVMLGNGSSCSKFSLLEN